MPLYFFLYLMSFKARPIPTAIYVAPPAYVASVVRPPVVITYSAECVYTAKGVYTHC